MKLFGYEPIGYFNRWLAEPIRVAPGASVQSVMEALNKHPLDRDETASDYIMPARRQREEPGRFRILGENQDNWYCFVYEGAEALPDPPVYFESCLDLDRDHGYSAEDIIDGDHVLVCPTFSGFLWHMLGQQICVRLEGNGLYVSGVHGIVYRRPVKLGEDFVNPLGREFPVGFACYFQPDVICIPDWGAAFLNAESERRFCAAYSPDVRNNWV